MDPNELDIGADMFGDQEVWLDCGRVIDPGCDDPDPPWDQLMTAPRKRGRR